MLDCNMLPTITHPNRITKNSATLIDSIFISEFLQRSFDSCLLINDMSDHLRTLVLFKQTHVTDNSPLVFKSRKLNKTKISTIKTELRNTDWNGLLNSESYNTTPEVTVKFLGEENLLSPG